MISTNEFRTGTTIELDGDVYTVVEFQHVKPGKGSAFVRTKLKNRRTGGVIERTFRAGEKVAKAHIEKRQMQYLYREGDMFTFMDTQTYDQVALSEESLDDATKFLKENMNIDIVFYQGQPMGIEMPISVVLKVIETEPGVKGDTATGATKNAKLETGVVVQVPLFVNIDDELVIDTRTGQYVQRA
jgi:elongation factor P